VIEASDKTQAASYTSPPGSSEEGPNLLSLERALAFGEFRKRLKFQHYTERLSPFFPRRKWASSTNVTEQTDD
jgi:hypothetical protein